MKPSKHGEYALRALIDLAIASELGRPMPSDRRFQIVRGGLKIHK
jgi:DNA-binding IscR family transcriptional regulator